MNYVEIPRLETRRLTLRKLRLDDSQIYFERIGSSIDVTNGMLWEPHRDVSESRASIEKALRRYEAGKCYRWAIALPSDDSVIGVIELLAFNEEKETCSFAYMLGREFWGKGYATEVLEKALDFAFAVLGVKQVDVDHFTTNPASGAVMRKVGMKYQGTVPEKYEKRGKMLDADQYSITKEEFYGK